MKPFAERNPRYVGVMVLIAVLAVVAGALDFSKIGFLHHDSAYHAQLADAGSLVPGEQVTVAGTRVGSVTGLHLDGDRVRLDFTIRSGLKLGSLTTLSVKILSPLGQEYVQLASAGPGVLRPGATIPLRRTSGTATILSTLDQAGTTLGSIDEGQLAKSLAVVSQDLSGTTPSATAAVIKGLGRLSDVIVNRQSELAQLVDETNQVVATLDDHRGQLVDLIGQAGLVLQVVQERQSDIKQVLDATTALSNAVSQIITNKQANLSALLTNLKTVSGVLANDSGNLAKAVPLLSGLASYLSNATGSGPYFDAIAPTLLVDDHLVAQCTKPGVTPPYSLLSPGCQP
ncbi:MCE family protein [Acidiferrimicrobium sp. IK]|uniref:MCE family protein n=1 Tax=Acidiferrimicrobium sp. IK TaxID=2871700 RepID=UPI0021CB95FA|nr:MCE family protein [Acidiferrimicrobium sp. IK]MCU4184184.1 MCE family protein [Acidiferrimicrobium sp. IK]